MFVKYFFVSFVKNQHTFIAYIAIGLMLLVGASIAKARTLATTPSAEYVGAKSALIADELIVPLGNAYQNSITLLNNRFRVDDGISEITIVFFREFGSPPIVLVRPDGSKLFIENAIDDESYTWFETDTYDMISLKNPMPGPWQAVGDILPESRIMIIADVTLNAQSIPKLVYAGETLKHTAYLENAGNKMDMVAFRDVISLSIDFVSTNNPEYPNFGLGSRTVARFEDNGLGFDESNGDGVFTGQFDLNIIEGEWMPIFTLRTPMFTREQVNEKVILLPNPILLNHQLSASQEQSHTLFVKTDPDHVALSSLILDGTVRLPSGDIERFSNTESINHAREISLSNAGYGTYKVNLSAYAVSTSGRDLMLNVPEYVFTIEPPPPVEIAPIEAQVPDLSELIDEVDAEQESSQSFSLLHILVINLVLLIVGMLALFAIADKRRNPDAHITKRLKELFKFKKDKRDSELTSV